MDDRTAGIINELRNLSWRPVLGTITYCCLYWRLNQVKQMSERIENLGRENRQLWKRLEQAQPVLAT